MIHAETEQQRRQAVKQMDGQLTNLYNKWRQTLKKVGEATFNFFLQMILQFPVPVNFVSVFGKCGSIY